MPTRWVDPEPLFEHQGVTIYPIWRRDDLDDVRRTYWYGYSPLCSDDGTDAFDIRDVEGFREGVEHVQFLKAAIEDGRLLKLVGERLLNGDD